LALRSRLSPTLGRPVISIGYLGDNP